MDLEVGITAGGRDRLRVDDDGRIVVCQEGWEWEGMR